MHIYVTVDITSTLHVHISCISTVYQYIIYIRVKQTCLKKKRSSSHKNSTTLRFCICKKISPCFFCICSSLQLLRFRSYPGLPGNQRVSVSFLHVESQGWNRCWSRGTRTPPPEERPVRFGSSGKKNLICGKLKGFYYRNQIFGKNKRA